MFLNSRRLSEDRYSLSLYTTNDVWCRVIMSADILIYTINEI